MRDKVYCDDCQEEVEEVNTVKVGTEIVCSDCMMLDSMPVDYLLDNEPERAVETYLH